MARVFSRGQGREGTPMKRRTDPWEGLPLPLRRFSAGMLAMVGFCVLAEWVSARALGLTFGPYDYPLGRTYFPDFVRFTARFQNFHSPAFFAPGPYEFLYPAPAAVTYQVFYGLFRGHALAGFLVFTVGSLVIAAMLFGRVLMRRGVPPMPAMLFPLLVVTCSYPVWTVFKQGNIEIGIWALVTAGIALFFAGRGYGAAACFGLAASMKIYPLVFLGLLIARRQFREAALGGCVLVGATAASLWIVCPDVAVSWQQYRQGLDHFRMLYVLHRRPEMGTDHSLFALVKLGLEPLPGAARMGQILLGYLLLVAIAGTGLYFLRIRHMPVVNQVICLSVASVLLPPVSYEYTLLQMFAPLALLVQLMIDGRGRCEPGVGAALVCVGLLLGVMPELIWHGQVFEGHVKAVVLLVLFAIAMRCPFDFVGG